MKIQMEGIDGSGKSTQAFILAKRILEERKKRVLVVKEYEASRFSRQLRSVIHSDLDRSALAEMFCFLATKAEFYSLGGEFSGQDIYILDRGWLSFLAPTAVSTGLSTEMLRTLLKIAAQGEPAPITVLLDIDPTIAQERLRKAGRLSRFDTMEEKTYTLQRGAYLGLVEGLGAPYIVLDGNSSQDAIAEQIWTFVSEWI